MKLKAPVTQLEEAYAGNGSKPQEPAPEQVAPAPVAAPVVAEAPAETPQTTLEEQLEQARREGAEEARRQAQATYEKSYKGLQRSLSQAQSENAQLRSQASQLAYIPGMQQVLNTLLNKTVGPEEAQRLNLEMENSRLKQGLQYVAELQQRQEQVPQEQTAYDRPEYEDTPAKRQEVLDHHFPGEAVATDDTRIDWALDIADQNPRAAQDRFKRSVQKILKEDAAKAVQAQAQKQVGKAQAALREAGVDASDGSLPTGSPSPLNPLMGSDPKQWKPRELFKQHFQGADPREQRAARKAQVQVFSGGS